MFGVETFRTFVDGWYDGSLQDVIFYEHKDPQIRRMICSILAGYVWDPKNPVHRSAIRAPPARAGGHGQGGALMRAAAALSGALMLVACATATRAPAPPAGVARPLVLPSEAGDRAVSQVVRGQVGDRVMTLSCVVTIKGEQMSVIGLNALGVRLFTLRYDGKLVSVEKSAGLPEQFKPEWLLADLQFVFWPLASLQGPLTAAGFEIIEPASGRRQLRRGGQLIAEAQYPGADPWAGRSSLVNLEYNYSLQIESGMAE